MPLQTVVQRAFSGGELAPALGARADQAKYLSGLKTCRNMIVQRHGGVTKRPGTKYVATTKSSAAAKFLTFEFEAADQTYLIEAGDFYFRFFYHGAPVVVSGVAAWSGATNYVVGDLVVVAGVNYYCILAHINHTPPNATYWYALTGSIYEVPTPYAIADVARLRTAQSADVLTIVHPTYAPRELKRLGNTDWTLTTITTTPATAAPTGQAGVAGAAGSLTFRYKITAFASATYEESLASGVATIINCDTPSFSAPNTLSWTTVSGAAEYGVYADPYNNGIYGLIGIAATNAFNDVGFVPDFSITPPVNQSLFASTGNYPSATAYYQQRQMFAGSNNEREAVWGSQIGAYHNFSIRTPLQSDDSVKFLLASNLIHPVRFLIDLKQLVVLTDAGEWVIKGDQSGALVPTAINAEQHGYAGSSAAVRPVVVGNSLLFVQARGTILRDFSFDQQQGGYVGVDLTVFATHLFDGYTLSGLAFAQQPLSVVWAVRSDGALLGLTYVKEQAVWGWHRHDTGASGSYEAVAVLPNTTAGRDDVYVVVKRTINGSTVRYIEKLMPVWRQDVDAIEDAFYVDAGLTYDSSPILTITGLSHLEGAVVAVLADGVVVFDGDPTDPDAADFTVASGQLTLPIAASVVQIGLPIRYAQIETLELDVQGSAVRDKRKRLQSLTVMVTGSPHGMLAGIDESHLVAERKEVWQVAVSTMTGQQDVNLTTAFTEHGRLILRHTDPLPWTVLGVMPNLQAEV